MRLTRSALLGSSGRITSARRAPRVSPSAASYGSTRSGTPPSPSSRSSASKLGTLLGGAVIIGDHLRLARVGRLSVQAIYNRDYPLVQASVFVLASTFVLVNLAVDLSTPISTRASGLADPLRWATRTPRLTLPRPGPRPERDVDFPPTAGPAAHRARRPGRRRRRRARRPPGARPHALDPWPRTSVSGSSHRGGRTPRGAPTGSAPTIWGETSWGGSSTGAGSPSWWGCRRSPSPGPSGSSSASSGYFGGLVDDLFMRLADIQLAFPFILLALAVIGPRPEPPQHHRRRRRVGLGGLRADRPGRGALAPGARVRPGRAGLEPRRVIVRHLVPNAFAPWLVIATLDMARVIIVESALSFLGLGILPSTPTWGGMLADGRVYMSTAWWLATFQGSRSRDGPWNQPPG